MELGSSFPIRSRKHDAVILQDPNLTSYEDVRYFVFFSGVEIIIAVSNSYWISCFLHIITKYLE